MIFPFVLALVAFVALLAIVAPLMRGRHVEMARASYDQAVYRDQLRELDRDIERGLLTPDEATAARLEIHRRLLATERDVAATTPARSQPMASPAMASPAMASPAMASPAMASPAMASPAMASPAMASPAMAAVVFLVIAAGSIGTYLWIGAPGMPDMPFSTRPPDDMGAGDKEHLAVQQAADQLIARLKADPSDARSWQMLARAEAVLGQTDRAIAAYKQAIAHGATDPETTAAYAETLVMAAGGIVTPAAEQAFRSVQAADQGSGVARYYLALAASQAGEPRKAIDGWLSLLADVPSDSPLRARIGGQIADAARAAGIPVPKLPPGAAPSAADPSANATADAAKLNDEQRQTMIRAMVASLAAKQAADPTDLAGWLQLGKAYAVLHDTDKAADAYDKAIALKPDDPSIPLQAAQALTQAQNPQQKLPPRLIALLRTVQLTNPKEPIVLWFLGVAALQDRQPGQAKRYWTDLLGVLPPSSQDARTVQTALDMLAKADTGTGG